MVNVIKMTHCKELSALIISINPISTGPLEDPVSTGGGVILTPPSNFETTNVTDMKFSP